MRRIYNYRPTYLDFLINLSIICSNLSFLSPFSFLIDSRMSIISPCPINFCLHTEHKLYRMTFNFVLMIKIRIFTIPELKMQSLNNISILTFFHGNIRCVPPHKYLIDHPSNQRIPSYLYEFPLFSHTTFSHFLGQKNTKILFFFNFRTHVYEPRESTSVNWNQN